MEFWFISNPKRLKMERNRIQEAFESNDWLVAADWKFIEGCIGVQAIIKAHSTDYPIELMYPALFPNTPAIVRPQFYVEGERWSEHQYPNGTLCLEWGPDNWDTEVTGAELLYSAYRLLYAENPAGTMIYEAVPSRHQLTFGQEMRSSRGRLHLSKEVQEYVLGDEPNSFGTIMFSFKLHNEALVCVVDSVSSHNKEPLTVSIPSSVFPTKYSGYWFKLACDGVYPNFDEWESIERFLLQQACPILEFKDNHFWLLIVFDDINFLHAHFIFKPEDSTIPSISDLKILKETPPDKFRTPPDLADLSGKYVGIVGVGSVGSKIASSLARTGLRKFYLVDEDIFMPENIVRHTLDWEAVGLHKVTAMKNQLEKLNPTIEVKTSKLNLIGQESASALSCVLDQLGECDLIIDATANPNVFNTISALVNTYSVPLVWVIVYAGGIGGLIARSRPQIDPPPQVMRALLDNYLASQDSENKIETFSNHYSALDSDGEVFVASDADVGIISQHACRLALDTIKNSDDSTYPYSMYLLGLDNHWIFKAPFHTIPIDVSQYERKAEDEISETADEDIAFLNSLLANASNENSDT